MYIHPLQKYYWNDKSSITINEWCGMFPDDCDFSGNSHNLHRISVGEGTTICLQQTNWTDINVVHLQESYVGSNVVAPYSTQSEQELRFTIAMRTAFAILFETC